MKFTLDVTLPARVLANRGDDVDDMFTRAVLAIDGVASVFGMNDFVTVTRVRGADWAPILDAVEDAVLALRRDLLELSDAVAARNRSLAVPYRDLSPHQVARSTNV